VEQRGDVGLVAAGAGGGHGQPEGLGGDPGDAAKLDELGLGLVGAQVDDRAHQGVVAVINTKPKGQAREPGAEAVHLLIGDRQGGQAEARDGGL
jgi:hypothetical protein